MEIAIIKYNAGNNRSVLNAFERIGFKAVLTDNPEQIRNADRVVFPGVGEASSAMKHLKEKGLDKVIQELQQPVLGICLGMQLLGKFSSENSTACLDIFPAEVKRFSHNNEQDYRIKIPQVGWNTVQHNGQGLFEGIAQDSYFYFVHSYFMEKNEATLAATHYGVEFSSAVQWRNFSGVQFHPEKSAEVGERLLLNFINRQ